MAAGPSIKGATIQRLVDDARAFLERSGADRERLAGQLSSEAAALLEHKLDMGRWYPITAYTEITELLWREEGGGDVAYLHRRGENIMRTLMEAGLYQQLEYLNRRGSNRAIAVTPEELLRTSRLVGSITGTIRNFGKDSWEWQPDRPGQMLHHVRDAADFPEVLRFVSEGAESYLVGLHLPDSPAVRSERRAPDHLVFVSDYSAFFVARA
jgi:hypothetical protein